MSKTFIDGLSDAEKGRLLRRLSKYPALFIWSNFVEPADALSAVHPAHPLSGVARLSLTKVHAYREPRYWIDPSFDEDTVRLANNIEICEWLQLAGQSVASVTFDMLLQSKPLRRELLSSLETSSASLRCLNIYGLSDKRLAISILRATSGRLRELEATGEHASGIEKYCAGLHELKIASASDLNFLKTIGPTLKLLHATQSDSFNPILVKLLNSSCDADPCIPRSCYC